MKNMKRMLASFAAIALVIGIAAPLSAQANPKRANEIRDQARARAEDKRQEKQERVAEIKQKVEARKIELQQERCERRQEKLQATLPRLSNGATTVKGTIDKVYERVQGFYASGQLTVSNYEELVNVIETTKADAETSLEALEVYEFEINCDDKNVGSQLDGFRTAVKSARDELKDYRKSVVDLISALRAEAAEDKEDSTDSEEDQSNDSDESDNETEQSEQETENAQ